jgi:hypothetical protein
MTLLRKRRGKIHRSGCLAATTLLIRYDNGSHIFTVKSLRKADFMDSVVSLDSRSAHIYEGKPAPQVIIAAAPGI